MAEFITISSYVFAFFVSLWFGNFITSFYFRIPRGIPLNGKSHPPMCSTCSVKLKYPDYGPLYYYLFRGKCCKVCGAKIPPEYFFIELFTAIACISIFILHGVSEKSSFMIFVVLSYILALLINTNHGRIPEKSLWISFVASISYVIFSLKYEISVLYIIITNVAVGFTFAMILQKLVLKKQLPEGYMPMIAMIAMVQTKGISILMFFLILIMITIFRKIPLKYFMSIMILSCIGILISDVSFPYLEL
jgi:prepilin signal peptidase PulO-like enzyme (type II secretory pathway)